MRSSVSVGGRVSRYFALMSLSEAQAHRLDLRRTRAVRPGQAGTNSTRGELYSAAIRQFEDLLVAAEAAGYAGRPLPLFYALSQAGRALVAAFGSTPTVDGHGLRELRTTSASVGLIDRAVDRAAKKSGEDSFSAVAAAINSSTFTGSATLGSIWAATPGASGLLLGTWHSNWMPPLLAVLGTKDARVGMTLFAPSSGPSPSLGELRVSRYSSIPASAVLEDTWGWGRVHGGESLVATVSWLPDEPTAEEALRGRLARTRTELFEDGTLLPSINDESAAMHPLMTWWTLLFALSIFARYHPTPWVEALDADRSPLAVPLQALLDVAPDAVTALVWEAVSSAEAEPLTIMSQSWQRMSAEEVAEHERLVAERGDPFRHRTTT